MRRVEKLKRAHRVRERSTGESLTPLVRGPERSLGACPRCRPCFDLLNICNNLLLFRAEHGRRPALRNGLLL